MRTIKCDECLGEIPFDPQVRCEGDLEVTYLRCPLCGSEHIGAVTDSGLRREIARYRRRSDAIAKGYRDEGFFMRTQRLHERNVRRGKVLRIAYKRCRHDNYKQLSENGS